MSEREKKCPGYKTGDIRKWDANFVMLRIMFSKNCNDMASILT